MKNKTSLTFCIIMLFIFLSQDKIHTQTIAPYFFGSNAWLTDTIGNTLFGGVLKNNWQKVEDSRCTSVRIGGAGYDEHGPTVFQLIKLIDSIQLNGGEPIVQISNWKNNGTYTAAMAKDRVTAINVTYLSSIQRKVKYWSIGNEPDHWYLGNNAKATGIASYVKSFATQMKLADSTIQIMAPELSYYNTSIMDSLTNTAFTTDITGKITGHTYAYVDLISFHYYPFPYPNVATRALVISDIKGSGKFKDNLDALNGRINTANSNHSRTSNPLKIAVTEVNINSINSSTASDTTLALFGANSFIAGQLLAEMMKYGMQDSIQFLNFWSVIEGSVAGYTTDLGYLRPNNASKRSTWYHFKMVADNFKGTYAEGTISTGQTDIKGFGSYDGNQVAVLIMNQKSAGGTYSYRLRLDNSYPSTGTVKMKIPANVSAEYAGTIADESTTLLVFDRYGNISTKTDYAYCVGCWDPPATLCTTAGTFTTQASLASGTYTPGIYSTITIGGTSTITINPLTSDFNNTIYRATGLITITGTNGPFSSGASGSSLQLINTACPY